MNQFKKKVKAYAPEWFSVDVRLKVDRNEKVQNNNSNKHIK